MGSVSMPQNFGTEQQHTAKEDEIDNVDDFGILATQELQSAATSAFRDGTESERCALQHPSSSALLQAHQGSARTFLPQKVAEWHKCPRCGLECLADDDIEAHVGQCLPVRKEDMPDPASSATAKGTTSFV